jgi:hypothetical protein
MKPESVNIANLIKVKTAADRVKVTTQHIYSQFDDGKLTPVNIDGAIFVDAVELAKWEAERQMKREESRKQKAG